MYTLQRLTTLSLLIYFASLISPAFNWASIYQGAVFPDARTGASILDLKLMSISDTWRQVYLISPPPEAKTSCPLIAKAQVSVELSYDGGNSIDAFCRVHNLNAFLSLSRSNRKALLKEIRSTLISYLLGRGIRSEANNRVTRPDVTISLTIQDVFQNDKGVPIVNILPHDLAGEAGYHNGEFVYSETYYLDLTVKNGVAQSTEENRIVIEKLRD